MGRRNRTPPTRTSASRTGTTTSRSAVGGTCARDAGGALAAPRSMATFARTVTGGNYNSDTEFPRRDGVPQNSGRAFIIFEHCGGTHYCGGWDTSWHHKELWIL